MNSKGIKNIAYSSKIYCRIFEHNSDASEFVGMHKLWPRAKHINFIYQNFISYVRNKSISIFIIYIFNQIEDNITNSLPQNDFLRQRKIIFVIVSPNKIRNKCSKGTFRKCNVRLDCVEQGIVRYLDWFESYPWDWKQYIHD